MSKPNGTAPSTWVAPTVVGFLRDLIAAFRECVKP